MKTTALGTITLTKVMDDDGYIWVNTDYEDLTIFEVIGMLLAEADAQRAVLQRHRND